MPDNTKAAWPRAQQAGVPNPNIPGSDGMTFREYLIGQCLLGYCSNAGDIATQQQIASRAVIQADFVLAVLEAEEP